MKKLISILLAVSLMAMSTMASAASTALRAGGQRNPGTGGTADNNSNYLRDYSNMPGHLAVYRPGDTLTFSNDTEKMKKGDVITFISSYVDANDYTSSTVMFIDQVTAESDSPSYSYKIREGLEAGIYKLEIKIGSNDVKTFYYGVSDVDAEIAFVDEAETIQYYYDEKDGLTYYFALASKDAGEFTFNQLGVAEFGFDFGNNNVFKADATVFDAAMAEQEIEGAVNWFYSIGVKDVAEGSAPSADAVLVNE